MQQLFKIIALAFVVLCVLSIPAYTQQDDIKITRIGIEEGFPQSRVNAITQDSAGFIWIGTIDGLYRYDGYTFEAYRNNPFDSSSLYSNEITQLYGDKRGRLWIITSKGLNMLNTVTNRMQRYTILSPLINRWDNFGVFFEDSKKNIWLTADGIYIFNETNNRLEEINVPQTKKKFSSLRWVEREIFESKITPGEFWIRSDSGLFRFNSNTGEIAKIQYRENSSPVNDLSLEGVGEDLQGKIWTVTNRTLRSFNKTTGAIKRYSLPKEWAPLLNRDPDFKMVFDGSGKLWIWPVWFDAGIASFDPATEQFTYMRDFIENGKRIPINSIHLILNWDNGDLWFSTQKNGLYRFLSQTSTWKHYTPNQSNSHSLSGDAFITFQDRNRIIWVGTYENGLNKIEHEPQKFRTVKSAWYRGKNVPIGDTRALYENKEGTLWVGSLTEGLIALDSSSNVLSRHTFFAISSILPDSHDSSALWISTWRDGIFRFDPRSGNSVQYIYDPGNASSISGREVRTVLQDHTGALWVGTWYSGLNQFNPATKQFTRYMHDSTDQSSLSENTVYCLYEDRSGTLWAGTKQGLNRFNNETKTFTRFLHNPNDSKTLRSNDIRCITEDKSGILWVGTNEGGLNRFDKQTGTFSSITMANGLPNDNIYGILEDGKGNLWLSTNVGLCRYSPQTGECSNYDTRDGLQNNEFNTGAYFKNSSGELYFGGINGFSVFSPDSIKDNPFVPPVYITGLKIYDVSLPLNEHTLQFDYHQDFITLEFVALNYAQPERNQYMIKMDGLDGEWHNIGTRRFAIYSHLAPGEYMFSVKGSNDNGRWNPVPASIGFSILPPFWATWWFRSLGITAFLAFGIAIYARRVSQLKREQRRQHEFSQQLIERQEQERKRIASELHDGVGQGLLVVKNKLLLTLDSIENNNINTQQLQDAVTHASNAIEEVRSISHNLRPSNLDHLGLTMSIEAAAESIAASSSIKFSMTIENIDGLITPENEINVYRIVQESLNNIIKHSQATEAVITILATPASVLLVMEDNGIGIPSEIAMRTEKKSRFGLSGMIERANVLSGTLTIQQRNGGGTKIQLTIPRATT